MAAVAVTYTFSNSTTADGTQVNQNFTDIVNGLSDGTKDLSINALTVAGNASFSGNTTFGNASGDDVLFTGSLAGTIPIKTTNTYDLGSSTLGMRAIYFGGNSQTVNIKASASMSATWTFTLPVSAGTSGYYLQTNGSGVSTWSAFTPPTIQKFDSGSGTYTTPANVKYIRVRMVGGGGGGNGSSTASAPSGGTDGGQSTFGTSLLVANGGLLGGWNSGPVAGGGGSISAPAIGSILPGCSTHGGSNYSSVGGTGISGGEGGASFLAGYGQGGYGADNNVVINCISGGGGTGGGGVDALIPAPDATYPYTVGSGGTGGSAGTSGSNGTGGQPGYIEVTEYYQ